MPLPIDDHLAALRREGDGLAAAAQAGRGAAVPTCPGWDVAQLVWHTGDAFHFWRVMAEERPEDGRTVEPPTRPPDDELLGWYGTQLDDLERALRETDPALPVRTWAGPQAVRWIVRRMAHEAAVHRWDAEAAAGSPSPVEPSLAVDGVDEFLAHFRSDPTALSGTIHLHATDAEGEWLVRLGEGTVVVDRGHAKGDAAVRATASDLLLLLWRRRTLDDDGFEVFGDRGLAAAFVAEPDLE